MLNNISIKDQGLFTLLQTETMKKIISFLAIASLSLFVFAGCASKNSVKV